VTKAKSGILNDTPKVQLNLLRKTKLSEQCQSSTPFPH